MLDREDPVCANSLVSWRSLGTVPLVCERVVVEKLRKLQRHGVCPFGIPGCFVKLEGMFGAARDFIAVLVALRQSLRLSLGLVDHAIHLLLVLDVSSETLPSRFVEQSVGFGVQGA